MKEKTIIRFEFFDAGYKNKLLEFVEFYPNLSTIK
jgi:hypothetical protein